jgi:hypothetical protein
MAFAGSASDLAKQPAPATSGERAGSWKPLVTTIVVVAIVVTAMATASFIGSNRVAPVAPAGPAGLTRPQIDDQLPVAAPGLTRPQIDDQLPVAAAGLTRLQIDDLQLPVAAAGLTDLQQSVSRTVYQTAPHRLRRTPR